MSHIPGIPHAVALRAEIKALQQTIQGYIQAGNYRRAANAALELGTVLEKLANLEMPNDRVRSKRYDPPPPVRPYRSHRAQAVEQQPRYEYTQVEPPALPEGE